MQCQNCSEELEVANFKFCPNCAHPVSLRCESCETEIPLTAGFCPECATPVHKTNNSKAKLVTTSFTPPPVFIPATPVVVPSLAGVKKIIEVTVPDIGDFEDVSVIEIMVKVGEYVNTEQSVLTVECDKASMEIPAFHSGVIKALKVRIGDKVREGSVIMLLESDNINSDWVAVTCPNLSKEVKEASIVVINAEIGCKVKCDQIMFEIETDKVVLEVPAPVAGVVKKLVVDMGDTVHSDQVLCFIEKFESSKSQDKVWPFL